MAFVGSINKDADVVLDIRMLHDTYIADIGKPGHENVAAHLRSLKRKYVKDLDIPVEFKIMEYDEESGMFRDIHRISFDVDATVDAESVTDTDRVDAVVKLQVPTWQLGQDVSVFFPDSMVARGTCEHV